MPNISLAYQHQDLLTDYLSSRDGFIWLHTKSMSGQEYDLLAFEPAWSLNNCVAEDIQRIEKLFRQFPRTENHDTDFFNGGLIGYLGYEFSRQQAHNKPAKERVIEKATERALPPDVHIGYYPTNYLVIDHEQKAISGDIADTDLFAGVPWKERIKHPAPDTTFDAFKLTSIFLPFWSQLKYKTAHQRIKQYLLQGDCYQVNLTQMLSANYIGDPYSIFKSVVGRHRTPNFAYIKTNKGDVLSFSPESFLSIERGQICTKPIKGTRKRDSDPDKDHLIAQELLASTKDRAENVMIVDLLRNDLGRIAKTGSVKVKQLCELETFSNVHHLVSMICAELKDNISPFEALLTCSPGGSITGAPKIRAMEIIDELEDFPRNVYCGSIFFCGHNGRLESNITIRTLTCRDGQAIIWGGGGIVADSIESAEYEESLFKIRHIINVLSETLVD